MKHADSRRVVCGFTIVELMVSIAIVALLVAMLLPALKKSKDAAKQTVCLTIERQYSLGFGCYVNDNKDAYPYVNQAKTPIAVGTYLVFGSVGQVWMQGIGPYLGASSSAASQLAAARNLRCPANPWIYTGTGPGNWAGSTYGMNGFANTSSPFPYSYGIGGDPVTDPTKFFPPKKSSQLRSPSRLCLIGDTCNLQAPTDYAYPYATNSAYASAFLDRTVFTPGSTSNNAWIVLQATWGSLALEITGYTRLNHSRGWNVLRADGSAGYYTKATMDKMGSSTGTNSEYQAFWNDR